MSSEARLDAGSTTYRGFMFADLRGFTAFAERHGNAAAADRVARFLEIARSAIARHEGAEIKTEGDAIHAVFPSASAAVVCGLEIVDAAEELNARQAQDQLDLGIGIHAGEAVATAEGYIGTAVNIAARVCAVAMPGEVLVTSTVKGITQANIPIGFVSRGRRRLKGIREPVELFAATHDLAAGGSRTATSSAVMVPAILGIIVVAIVAILGAQLVGAPAASPPPTAAATPASAAATAQPLVIGPLRIGTYATQGFLPEVTLEVLDQGWTANRDTPSTLGLIRDVAPLGGISFLIVNEVVASPCVEGGEGIDRRPVNQIGELQFISHLTVSTPTPVVVGGFAGEQVDVTVSEGALAACGGLVGAEVPIFVAAGDVWRASPSERFRVMVVAVGSDDVTIVMSTDWTQNRSVQELQQLFELGQHVVDSVEFAAG